MTPERPQVGDTVSWCGARFTVRAIQGAHADIASTHAAYTVNLALLRVVARAEQPRLL